MRVSADYEKGYTKCLLDMYQFFTQYEAQFSKHHILSRRASDVLRKMIDALIDGRMLCIRYGMKNITLVRLKDKTYKVKLKEDVTSA